MLFSAIRFSGICLPHAIESQLRREYYSNAFHSLANTAELIDILRDFGRRRIDILPHKGVVLSASAYGSAVARPAGDLDLLIHFRDLQAATEILLARGYKLTTPRLADGTPVASENHEYSFEREADGRLVELHWKLELVFRRSGPTLDMSRLSPHRRSIVLAGTCVPDLAAEMKLLMLCMHGSKHVWSRLIWISDVARVIATSPNLDWDSLIRESRRRGLSRPLALGMLLAHRLAGAEIPPALLWSCESDRGASELAHHIQSQLFEAPGSVPKARVPYNIRLLGFRHRAKAVLSGEFLRPSERDEAVLNLPRPLRPFYFLIRPLRLVWDKSAR